VPWLGLFGDQDASIPVDDVERLRAVLAGAAAPTEIVRYPDAGHGFHCDRRADYVEGDARDAWARTLAWFGTYLPPAPGRGPDRAAGAPDGTGTGPTP
jgi:carboxymethylenebutenolidase